MRFLSLFSGIEAASAALVPMGWECVAVAEIELFPRKTLAHHYPDVPNLGDVTKITEEQIAALGPLDVVVFGSPCQDLSIAGPRKGMINADGTVTRSGLFFTAINIFQWARKHCGARFAWWENVAGAYSSNKGRDFASVVEYMAGLDDVAVPANGWGTEGCAVGDNGMLEWSCLDAQWFGVAQRRRRVFAVLDTGDWSNRPPILLERQSMRGDSAPRRETGESIAHPVAPCLTSSGRGVERGGDTRGQDPVIAVAFGGNNTEGPIEVATARNACASASGRMDFESETFLVQSVALRGREGGATAELGGDVATALRCGGGGGDKPHVLAPIAFSCKDNGRDATTNLSPTLRSMNHSGSHANGGGQMAVCVTGEVTHTLKADGFDGSEDGTGRGQPIVAYGWAVRRLTPRECERLMGQRDDYTLIPVKKAKRRSSKFEYAEIDGQLWQLAADGPRYKALGNSMAVPCMSWIGQRIQMVAA